MDKILATHVSVGRTLDIKDEPATDYYSVFATESSHEDILSCWFSQNNHVIVRFVLTMPWRHFPMSITQKEKRIRASPAVGPPRAPSNKKSW